MVCACLLDPTCSLAVCVRILFLLFRAATCIQHILAETHPVQKWIQAGRPAGLPAVLRVSSNGMPRSEAGTKQVAAARQHTSNESPSTRHQDWHCEASTIQRTTATCTCTTLLSLVNDPHAASSAAAAWALRRSSRCLSVSRWPPCPGPAWPRLLDHRDRCSEAALLERIGA